MLCPSCHTRNRENARFCKGCGQALAIEVVVNTPTQVATATAPTEPSLDKTVPALPGFASTPTLAPSMPQEPTQYLQPQPHPQSTEQHQPANHRQAGAVEQGQAQGTGAVGTNKESVGTGLA